ncbi:MAG: hypothetical protein ACFFDP_00555 [Promethearchaeota archaeon]
MLSNETEGQWFYSQNRRLISIAFPIATALSVLSIAIGVFASPFALPYLSGAYMLSNLAIFSLCLPLLRLQNSNARRLMLTFTIMGLLRIISSIYLIIETLVLGVPISFPSISLIIETIANITLILGLVLVSSEQRKRSYKRILGYLLLCILFGICIFSVYLTNIAFHSPLFPAIGAGIRILLSLLTAVFAWSFFFNKDPPHLLIGPLGRLLILLASIIQLLGHTLFAFQYAANFTAISLVLYAGSESDVILIFAQFVLLIAIFSIFIEIIGAKSGPRPISYRYSAGLTTLIVSLLVGTILAVTIIAITLIGQILLVFISPMETTVAVQAIVWGLLLGVGIIIVFGGFLASTLSKLIMRPLEKLDVQVQSLSTPTFVTFHEPPDLVFVELQSISDSFRALIDRLRRAHSELRTLSPPQRRDAFSQQKRVTDVDSDYRYLYNEVSNYCQIILTNAELMAEGLGKDSRAKDYIRKITSNVEEIHNILTTIQTLRRIEAREFPDISLVNLKTVLSDVITELNEAFKQKKIQIKLRAPKAGCKVLANDFLIDLFTIILQNAIQQDSHADVVVEILVSKIIELGKIYWRTMITSYGWILTDEEKDTIFSRDLSQYRTTGPDLVKAAAFAEAFQGKIRVADRVPGDHRYGSVFIVLLPVAQDKTSMVTKTRSSK